MYLEVVEEWKRREEALISEEEKQSLTEALIKNASGKRAILCD